MDHGITWMRYLWGPDGEIYQLGPEVLNMTILLRRRTEERVLAKGVKLEGNNIKWDSAKSYPREPKYYLLGFMVLTDYEIDAIACKTDKPMEISKQAYEFFRQADISSMTLQEVRHCAKLLSAIGLQGDKIIEA